MVMPSSACNSLNSYNYPPQHKLNINMSGPYTMQAEPTETARSVQQPTLTQLVRWGIANDGDYLSEHQSSHSSQDTLWYNYNMNSTLRYDPPSHQDTNMFEDMCANPPSSTLQELEISTSDTYGDYRIRLEQSNCLETFYPDTVPNIPLDQKFLEMDTYGYNHNSSFTPQEEKAYSRPIVILDNESKAPQWQAPHVPVPQYQIPIHVPSYKNLNKKTVKDSVSLKRKYVKRMSKEEQKQNGNNLWQFLMRLLTTRRDVLAWTGKDLEFRIANKNEVARMWGLTKNRTEMNFDKFSRAMRYYYNKRILYHNPQCRLTYSFMRNPGDIVFSEMLQEAMKTLPNQKAVCDAYCTDPNHAHEEQYDLRKKRQKKAPKGRAAYFPVSSSNQAFVPRY